MKPDERYMDLVILDQAGVINASVSRELRQAGLEFAIHSSIADTCQTLINQHPALIVFLPLGVDDQAMKACTQLADSRSPGQDRLVVMSEDCDWRPNQLADLGIDDMLRLTTRWRELGRRLKLMSLSVRRIREQSVKINTPSPEALARVRVKPHPPDAPDHVLLVASHHQRAQQVLIDAMDRRTEGAILLIQIHSVSGIFRSFGYSTGTRLLNRFSQMLIACTRAADDVISLNQRPLDPAMIAKVADADFVVLLGGSGNRNSALKSLSARIQRSVGDHIEIDGQPIPLVFSFGYARWPEDGRESDQILMAACESARTTNPGSAVIEKGTGKQQGLLADLYEAIAKREIELFYQPRVQAGSGRILGFEALARWRHGGESIPPDVFVPLAEEHGMISQLGLLVAEQAIDQHQRWREMGCGCVPISINVSPFQFDEGSFATRLLEMCQATGTAPGSLEIEITESSMLRNEAATLSQLKFLRDSGVGVALDDFGTGYSSLSHLQKLELDALKIDRSFISALADPTFDPGLVVSIIGIGINLGLNVVAEGVESADQAQMLYEWGCHELQGYHFSPPVDADRATILLSYSTLPAKSSLGSGSLKVDASVATGSHQDRWVSPSGVERPAKKQSRSF